jgi:hypothetical protein
VAASLEDGTASACLALDAPADRVAEAVALVMGTAADRFYRIEPLRRTALPPPKGAPAYLLEVDGVWLPMALSRHMVVTVHANRPGVLLVLLGVELRAVGRIVKDTPRFFEGTGEILLPDGTVAVEARGRYLRMPIERIADTYAEAEDWRVVASPDDPATIAVEGPCGRDTAAG